VKVLQKQNVERRKNYPTLGHALILHQQIILRECEYHSSSFIFNDGNYCSIPPTLDGWVYIDPIHGPLDGPLYTWAQYTPTPPRSLNYRRSGVQDWTKREYK